MPNSFKSLRSNATTVATNIYTAPAANGSSAMFQHLQLTNINGASAVTATIEIIDATTSANFPLLYNTSIPAGSAISAFDGKLIIGAGDSIRVVSTANSAVVVTGSIIEVTP